MHRIFVCPKLPFGLVGWFAFLSVTSLCSIQSPVLAVAQSVTVDPVKQKLQDEKDKADLRKAIADDNKAIAQSEADTIKANYAINTDKLPQGNATLGDKLVIEGTILAYRAAQEASAKVATALTANPTNSDKTCPGTLLFYEPKQMNDIWGAAVFKEQLKLIQQQGQELDQPVARFLPIPIGAAIDAGISLLSLFKTDVTMQGVSLAGDDLALQAMIVSELQTLCSAMTYVNSSYFVGSVRPGSQDGTILNRLGKVLSLRNTISARAAAAQTALKASQKELDDLNSKLDVNKKATLDDRVKIAELTNKMNLATTTAEKRKVQKKIDAVNADLSKLVSDKIGLETSIPAKGREVDRQTAYYGQTSAFVTSVDSLNTALIKLDESGVSLLNRMLRAESLSVAFNDKTRFLYVHFVALGGNNITKKHFFHTSIAFSGGSVVDYLMTNEDGHVVKAGAVSIYGKKVSEDQLNKTLAQ